MAHLLFIYPQHLNSSFTPTYHQILVSSIVVACIFLPPYFPSLYSCYSPCLMFVSFSLLSGNSPAIILPVSPPSACCCSHLHTPLTPLPYTVNKYSYLNFILSSKSCIWIFLKQTLSRKAVFQECVQYMKFLFLQ